MKKLLYISIILLFILFGCGGNSEQSRMPASVESDSLNIGFGDAAEGIGDENASGLGAEIKSISTVPPPPPNTIEAENGTLVYKVDSVLTIGVVSRVEARILKKIGKETTSQLVEMTTHTTTGVIKTEIIKVGDIMDMELISLQPEVFSINEVSNGDQPVDETTVTEWLWGVTAKNTGEYNLILKAKIKGVSRDKIVFDKQISVKNKPKKMYTINVDISDKLVRYEDNTLRLDILGRVSDTYNIEWGGNGKVVLDFPDLNIADDVKITTFDNYDISDDKSIFNYKWTIKPQGNQDSLRYTITIIGDYEELIICNRYIKINKNIKGTFEIFMDKAAERWYWVFTALLIPLYQIIKKKYFPEKKIFKRRRRKPTPKPN
jgi:hypothetical protein